MVKFLFFFLYVTLLDLYVCQFSSFEPFCRYLRILIRKWVQCIYYTGSDSKKYLNSFTKNFIKTHKRIIIAIYFSIKKKLNFQLINNNITQMVAVIVYTKLKPHLFLSGYLKSKVYKNKRNRGNCTREEENNY